MTPGRKRGSGRGGRSGSRRPSRPTRRASRKRPKGGAGVGRVLLFGAVLVGLAVLGARFFDGDAAEAGVAADLVPWTEGRVRVEVLNGGGVTGMARAATGVLRDAGFDVVGFGNAAAFDPTRPSVVIDRVGRSDVAHAVARALGVDSVRSEQDPNLYVDVSVVLGREWTARTVAAMEEAPGPRGPWDPRSWFDR